jgi:hypothetical protein
MALGQSSGGPGRQLSIFLSLTSPLARNAKSNKTKPKSRGHSLCGEKLEVPQRQGQASSQEGSPPEKKPWGFRRQRKASWRKGRTKPRRVGERGAQNRGELATGGPNQVNRKRQRQRCGGEKTWGFQRERETAAGKRSAQNRSEW